MSSERASVEAQIPSPTSDVQKNDPVKWCFEDVRMESGSMGVGHPQAKVGCNKSAPNSPKIVQYVQRGRYVECNSTRAA